LGSQNTPDVCTDCGLVVGDQDGFSAHAE
jgi:hypothetical protein